MLSNLRSGKKTTPLKTKTNEYCHDEFIKFCRFLSVVPAKALRNLTIFALIIWQHPRFNELHRKIQDSDKNEKGVIGEIIDCYLDEDKNSNVYRIEQRPKNR